MVSLWHVCAAYETHSSPLLKKKNWRGSSNTFLWKVMNLKALEMRARITICFSRAKKWSLSGNRPFGQEAGQSWELMAGGEERSERAWSEAWQCWGGLKAPSASGAADRIPGWEAMRWINSKSPVSSQPYAWLLPGEVGLGPASACWPPHRQPPAGKALVLTWEALQL